MRRIWRNDQDLFTNVEKNGEEKSKNQRTKKRLSRDLELIFKFDLHSLFLFVFLEALQGLKELEGRRKIFGEVLP